MTRRGTVNPHKSDLSLPRSASPGLSLAATCVVLMLCLAICGLSAVARAEEENTDDLDILLSAQQLEDTIKRGLADNQAELKNLESQLQQLDTIKVTVGNEIKVYESQNATHGQLLLATQATIAELERALSENRLTSKVLSDRLSTFQKSHDEIALIVQASNDRRTLAGRQIDHINESQFSPEQKQHLQANARQLLQILDQKNKLGSQYIATSGELLERLQQELEERNEIAAQLAVQIEARTKASFLSRTDPLRYFSWHNVQKALRSMAGRFQLLISPMTWKAQWSEAKMGGLGRWAVFMAALAVILALQGRCRAYMQRVETKCEVPGWDFRCLGLMLLRRSLPYLGLTIFFGFYSVFELSLLDIGLKRFLFNLFLILLIASWGMDYLDYGFQGPPTGLRTYVVQQFKRLFIFFRTATIVIVLLYWIAGRENLVSRLAWDFYATAYLVWLVVFWKKIKPVVTEGVRDGQAAPDPKRMAMLRGGSFVVVGGGLLLSLLGYNILSDHWMTSWIKTIVLLFWSWISLNAIREWQRDHKAEAEAADEDQIVGETHPWRWSMIQLARFFWLFGLAAGLLWSWDSSGFLRAQLGRFIGLSFTIGKVNLSIKGILMAVVIVYLTQLAVRIGRALINSQILEKRQLERGFKDSVLTVSSYLGWGIGLLMALAVIGVDATSLAVVFGALSVGIGFGLQNIFNNFISGLILLFERPIQVGDYVEVGGLWAEVKKINVRATVVQTFDNAAVIIPNSEFISQRVTNWSFKDKRMRRNLEVGVAYGSDIELVSKTLQEIVRAHKKVYKYPRPDVLFIDHGASALTFRLRIWTHVDDFWSVPSQIRFDIDRRFRELGIEIAFPQQDIHIRSYPEEFKPRMPAAEKPAPP